MTNRHDCNVLSFTLFGLKAHIVDLVNMAQYKWVGAVNMTIWSDSKVTMMRQTADHMNGCFIAVCCSIKDHVITPRTILFHVC